MAERIGIQAKQAKRQHHETLFFAMNLQGKKHGFNVQNRAIASVYKLMRQSSEYIIHTNTYIHMLAIS